MTSARASERRTMIERTLLPLLGFLVFSGPALAVAPISSGGDWEYLFSLPGGPEPTACEDHWRQTHAAIPEPTRALKDEFIHYQQLVEQALVYRARTIEWGKRLKDQSGPLSGADLQLLNEGMAAHLILREQLMRVAEGHECWLNPPAAMDNALTSRQRLEGIMLSLSAALVLYDNYLLSISLFEEDARLRQVLNDSDSGYGIDPEILTRITLSYNSVHNRARVRSAIGFYEEATRELAPVVRKDARLRYLAELIEQSPSYDMTKAVSPAYVVGRKLRFLERLTRDQLAGIANDGVSLFSMLFGNTVGLVETRKGKLHGRTDVHTAVTHRLRAGDILLEKTPFRLTDTLIPGHWGHAAVWIGTERELRELGLWDHPLVAPHHAAIRAGAGVLEALRSGVELNPLERFLNVDDLAVLRARDMDETSRAAIVLNALRQVGKAYDFNFDVETTDRIVCSELVYVTHTSIQWPTTRTLGRATISPDQIAAKALAGGPLELVTLYHDGQHVATHSDARLAQLMQESDNALPSLHLSEGPPPP